MTTDQAIMAQAVHEEALLSKRNVVGVAVGYKNQEGATQGDVAVVVLVERKLPIAALSVDDMVPRELEGMRTDVVEVGVLRALQTPRERFRPTIPGGVSMGHYKITAGTLGAIVRDRATNELLILSNNHVLANSNDALKGDPILQPGPTDGGKNPGDMVATLERFIPLRYVGDTVEPPVTPTPNPNPNPTPTPNPTPPAASCDVVSVIVSLANAVARMVGSNQRVAATTSQALATAALTGTSTIPVAQTTPENRVDCALAKPSDPAMFDSAIQTIGTIAGTKPATLGMRVRKYGRTTEYTEGVVTLINATVNVGYSTAAGPRTARFVGQTITEAMSKGGDSGSLVVDTSENKAVGLLFAGSDLATIFTPIDVVLDALNIKF
ncbi:MAG: hypothetical protein IPK19_14925 [Chloroflexi bacterium]|nr:hypothetical protein [Chloroflexota bacterium]